VRAWYKCEQTEYKTGDLAARIERLKTDPDTLKDFCEHLQAFSDLEPLSMHRMYASYLKGIFHKNGLLLTGVNIDNHFNGTPEEIDLPTLKDLYNSLSHRQQVMVDTIAETGIRPRQLRMTRLD
jgi:hypothetical protein